MGTQMAVLESVNRMKRRVVLTAKPSAEWDAVDSGFTIFCTVFDGTVAIAGSQLDPKLSPLCAAAPSAALINLELPLSIRDLGDAEV